MPTTPLWTETAQARALLASCVANQPAAHFPTSPFKRGIEMDTRGCRYDPTDARVIALGKLWDAATDLTHCPSKNDDPAGWTAFRDAWGAQYEMTVDAAITLAITAAHYSREAGKIAA